MTGVNPGTGLAHSQCSAIISNYFHFPKMRHFKECPLTTCLYRTSYALFIWVWPLDLSLQPAFSAEASPLSGEQSSALAARTAGMVGQGKGQFSVALAPNP